MTKLTEQQERFCRYIIEGLTQTEAYKRAGFKAKTDDVAGANASRLIGNDRIKARLEELRKPIAAEASVTLAWLVKRAIRILDAAEEDRAHSASVAALKELGILSGERVERSERTNRNVTVDDLSDSDLSAYLASDGGEGAIEAPVRPSKPDTLHGIH